MQNQFAPPSIPAPGAIAMPLCPRRLLNENRFLKDMTLAVEAPMTSGRKMRLRYAAEQPVMVNDAGMVRASTMKGQKD